MSISDRLDEIMDRYVEWHQDRGNHTPAPDTETWQDADYPDESMDHCIVRNDVPAMLAALRAVLDLHQPYDQCDDGCCRYCEDCEHEWPCSTRSAAAAALGEGA